MGLLALAAAGLATRRPAQAGCVPSKSSRLKLVSATGEGARAPENYAATVTITSLEGGIVEITARPPTSTPFWRERDRGVAPAPAP